MDILEWIEKAERFDKNEFLSDFAKEIAFDDKVIDLQRQRWGLGLSYNNKVIGRYKKSTEEISGGMKKAGDPYNLFFTGDFWSRTYINILIKGGEFEVEYTSDGNNKADLFRTIEKYGKLKDASDIFGLDNDDIAEFIEMMKPKYITLLEQYYN